MIEYLRAKPLELPLVVDAVSTRLDEGMGTLTPSFKQGELLLTNKDGQAYRLTWNEGSDADTRALPAGVYNLHTYRILRKDGDDTWHLSASAQSIKKIKVKAGENRIVEIDPAIRMESFVHGDRALMSIKGDGGAGLSIYLEGKRIPIGYRILDKGGKVLSSGDMRYG